LRLLGALLLALAVTGCSALRIGYNQADLILAHYVNDYFDLDRAQRVEFEERTDRFLAWHRRVELPDYVAFLTQAKARVERGVTREDVHWLIDGAKSRFRTLAAQAAPDAAPLLATLTDAQVAHLQEQWDKDNAKFAREWKLGAPEAERRRIVVRKTLDQVRDWTGALTVDQEKQITELLRGVPLVTQLRHEDRIRRQKEFASLLADRRQPDFAAKLRAWLTEWEAGRNPEYERMQVQVTEQRIRIILAVQASLTPEQKRKALHRLQDYIDDLRSLSAQRVAGQ
jgi:hypothetical protein